MLVLVADPAGACYGVERALRLADNAATAGTGDVYTLGPLIHNPIVVRELEKRGVGAAHSVDDCKQGTLVIRSHGVPAGTIEDAKRRGLNVVDATCPHVSRVQKEAAKLAGQGRFVIIVGESGHPEVEAILSYAGSNAAVVEDAAQVPDLPADTRIGVVVQTTQPLSRLECVARRLQESHADVVVENTICTSTADRQKAAMDLADKVDVMIVVGGHISGNTRRLFEICRDRCDNTYHIESSDELDLAWFEGCSTVGITAGASTPQSHIDAVVRALEHM